MSVVKSWLCAKYRMTFVSSQYLENDKRAEMVTWQLGCKVIELKSGDDDLMIWHGFEPTGQKIEGYKNEDAMDKDAELEILKIEGSL